MPSRHEKDSLHLYQTIRLDAQRSQIVSQPVFSTISFTDIIPSYVTLV